MHTIFLILFFSLLYLLIATVFSSQAHRSTLLFIFVVSLSRVNQAVQIHLLDDLSLPYSCFIHLCNLLFSLQLLPWVTEKKIHQEQSILRWPLAVICFFSMNASIKWAPSYFLCIIHFDPFIFILLDILESQVSLTHLIISKHRYKWYSFDCQSLTCKQKYLGNWIIMKREKVMMHLTLISWSIRVHYVFHYF